ncbi:hypothetical protein VR010_14980 [Actinomycetaceae bacterium L2_0104]
MNEIISRLAGAGVRVFDTDASEVDFTAGSVVDQLPYVLVMGSEGQPSADVALACADATDSLMVRHVGGSAESVRVLARKTRGILNTTRVHGSGYVSDVVFESTGRVYFDPDLVIEGLGTHPHILNDDYSVWTQQF